MNDVECLYLFTVLMCDFCLVYVALSFEISWEPAMRMTWWNLEIKRDL